MFGKGVIKITFKEYSLTNYSNSDISISNVIVLHLYILICKNMLVNVSDFWFGYNNIFNNLITVFFAIIYLRLFFVSDLTRKIKSGVIAMVLFVILFILITYGIDSNRFTSNVFPYTYVKTQLRTFVAYCLPLFIVVSTLTSIDCLLERLYKFTFLPFVISTISFLFSLQPHENGVYMSYGNAVMFLSVLLLFKYAHTKNLFDLIQFALTCLYILISGSRGPLVSIFIAVFFVMIIFSKRNPLLLMLLVLMTFLIVLFYNQILDFIISVLERMNVRSRTILMYLEGNITSDSDRSLYHEKLLEQLNQNPIIGLGAFGGEAVVGLAHSLYLDILANFGYLFGSLFIGYIIIKDSFLIIKYKGTGISELLLILSIIIFPRGFFDESFWNSKELWMIMGLFIQIGNAPQTRFAYLSKKQTILRET